jgi:hypothetical protein
VIKRKEMMQGGRERRKGTWEKYRGRGRKAKSGTGITEKQS